MNSRSQLQGRPQSLDPNSRTPRVDAAERFFYSQSKQPVGFVLAEVARQLELELAEAVELLQRNGIVWPKPQEHPESKVTNEPDAPVAAADPARSGPAASQAAVQQG